MRHLATIILILPLLCACASHADRVRNSIAAVVQDESQRQKVVAAVQAGDTPAQAMDKVADGPKHEKVGPY